MRLRALLGAALLVPTVLLAPPALAQNGIDDLEAELEAAQQRRQAIEDRLATSAGDIEGLEDRIHAEEEELATLEREDESLRATVEELEGQVRSRMRTAFMQGAPSAVELLLAGQDPSDVAERAVLLESLALRDRAAGEELAVLRQALALNQQQQEEQLAELDQLRADLEAQAEQLAADLLQVQEDEERFGEELERLREEERRRREEELRRQREEELRQQREAEERRRAAAAAAAAEEEAAAAAAAEAAAAEAAAEEAATEEAPPPADEPDDPPASTSPAPSGGGYACPVGNPVVFTDTWGAPRSGGRSHQGVDMMAPHGTPIYAITSGRITSMQGSALGGISLYMFGDDGNEYFYTHLQGYVSGISVGQRVSAGTHIAYNGSTGNASASAPHLHFEVHPGGGAPVNPYPYAAMACGR